MEFIIITIFILYIIFNEIHKYRLKHSEREYYIPREFYENLKDVIMYIDLTLESIKNKQESINKVFLKIQELKKELEEWEKSKNRRMRKKSQKNPEREEISEEENNNRFWEDLIHYKNDRIDFSFRNESRQNLEENKNQYSNSSSLLSMIRKSIRTLFNKNRNYKILEHKDFQKDRMITLQEFESSLEKKTDDIPLEERLPEVASQSEPEMSSNKEDPKQILIKESKKIFDELSKKEEQYKFVHKLIKLGFHYDEIHQITGFSTSEIKLISSLRNEKL